MALNYYYKYSENFQIELVQNNNNSIDLPPDGGSQNKIEINQETNTNSDGIKIIYNNNHWKIFLDSDNDLNFSYNDVTVHKISHD